MELKFQRAPRRETFGQIKPCCCSHGTEDKPVVGGGESAALPVLPVLKDPVCGMTVTTASKHSHDHEGHLFYFCSAGCETKFIADPKKYLVAPNVNAPAINEQAPVGAIYTCPMHPEVRQDHPGACPKCGMALEPELPSLDEDENPELTDFRRRFWWTLPSTIVVTTLAMLGHRLQWFGMATQSWIELVLTLPGVLWAGAPFFVRGWHSVVNRSPNMWTLIGLGTGAAFAYSVVATVDKLDRRTQAIIPIRHCG